MIPDQRIIENIQKLKELGMSESEISENLTKIGLSKEESTELIKTAIPTDQTSSEDTKITKIKAETEIPAKPKKSDNQSKEETSSEIPNDFFSDFEKPKKIRKSKLEIKADDTDGLDIGKLDEDTENENSDSIDEELTTDEIKDNYDKIDFAKFETENSFTKEVNTPETSTTQDDIWKSGIVTTTNTKLVELDAKQKQIEEYLKQKVDNEIEKINKIQTANSQLYSAKINDLVKNEVDNLRAEIIRELAKFKVIEVKLNSKMLTIEQDKTSITNEISKLESVADEVRQTEVSTQTSINSLLSTTTEKLNAKVKQINDTLALQSRIIQGLIKNTQMSVKTEVDKLIELRDTITKQIDPKKIYNKLAELDQFKQQMANRYEERFENVKTEFLVKAREGFKQEIDKELKDLTVVKDTIVAKTDPEIINKKLRELEEFEGKLVSATDEKISQALKIYESAITQEFKSKMSEIEKFEQELQNQIHAAQIAQDKIDEIDKFKEQFIAIVDTNIDKMNKALKIIEEKIKG